MSLFPHLYAMKEANRLSSEDMGAIIGKSRQTYEYKAQYGNFTPLECKAFCRKFQKSFDYLFATEEEIDVISRMATEIHGYDDATHIEHTAENPVCRANLTGESQEAV